MGRINKLVLGLLVLAVAPWACDSSESGITGVILVIRSNIPLSTVELRARDQNQQTDVRTESVAGRDLSVEPLRLELQPSSALGGTVHLYARGLLNATLRAANSVVIDFSQVSDTEIDLLLLASFVDQDEDGFEACTTGPYCDCRDLIASINPFAAELCGDGLDNNCSGWPADEGCPCDPVLTPERACSTLTGTDLETRAGIGACDFGVQLCQADGTWETGCTDQGPVAEVPSDYIDNDCDGTVDELSPCTAGATRPCHRGFVDDAGNLGDPFMASSLALGVCGDGSAPHGLQECETTGGGTARWGPCLGDVLPERAPGYVGWAERDTTQALPHQCDGLDNDCDGKVDEEPYFDVDDDGYTFCGTTFSATNPFSQTGTDPIYVDCNDDDETIFPNAVETCGDANDEDCRCNHGVEIGNPSMGTTGASLCSGDESLVCSRLPRQGGGGYGDCSNGPTPYYAGFDTNGNCRYCGKSFGSQCISAPRCSTQAEDCIGCKDSGGAFVQGGLAFTRQLCRTPPDPSLNLCENDVGIGPTQWSYVAYGTDTYNECSGYTCNTAQGGTGPYYFGIAGIECYYRANTTGECDGSGVCRTRPVECAIVDPGNPSHRGNVDTNRPECMAASSGCTGTTPPSFNNFVLPGEDPANECTGACDGEGACQRAPGGACNDDDDCYDPANPIMNLPCINNICCNHSGSSCPACQRCDVSGSEGTCTNVPTADSDNAQCAGPTQFCCEGECVDTSALPSPGDFGESCGDSTQGCGGTWMCNNTPTPSEAQCSSSAVACSVCQGDQPEAGNCSVYGDSCAGLTAGTACDTCFRCERTSATDRLVSCVSYGQDNQDPTAPNTCVDSGDCGGTYTCACFDNTTTVECRRALGQCCAQDTECASESCNGPDAGCPGPLNKTCN